MMKSGIMSESGPGGLVYACGEFGAVRECGQGPFVRREIAVDLRGGQWAML